MCDAGLISSSWAKFDDRPAGCEGGSLDVGVLCYAIFTIPTDVSENWSQHDSRLFGKSYVWRS